jgi:hypothetical protein
MGDKIKLGDFGLFEFSIRYKNKYGEQLRTFAGHFEVIDADNRNVILSDGMSDVLVTRRRISLFEPKEKPVNK